MLIWSLSVHTEQKELFLHTALYLEIFFNLQYNLNGSNPNGSFTVDDSNSFFSPYKILQIAQENKYLGIFSDFIMELNVVCCVHSLELPQWGNSNEYTQHTIIV